jgi:hypothetical protein
LEVAKVVEDLKAEVQEHAELIIRLLALTPGWKETNFQVLAVPFQNRLWFNPAMRNNESIVCHCTDFARDTVYRLSLCWIHTQQDDARLAFLIVAGADKDLRSDCKDR